MCHIPRISQLYKTQEKLPSKIGAVMASLLGRNKAIQGLAELYFGMIHLGVKGIKEGIIA